MVKAEKITENAAALAAHQPVINLKGNSGEVPLIFEETSPGRSGIDLLAGDESERRACELLGEEHCRTDIEGFPELSEPQVVRHFLRLSQMNFGQALQFYPLGSCTMKYNPRVNDAMATLPGLRDLHPFAPDDLSQGALQVMYELERSLASLFGMAAFSLNPAAGAHAELAALLIAKKFFHERGEVARAEWNHVVVEIEARVVQEAAAGPAALAEKQGGPRIDEEPDALLLRDLADGCDPARLPIDVIRVRCRPVARDLARALGGRLVEHDRFLTASVEATPHGRIDLATALGGVILIEQVFGLNGAGCSVVPAFPNQDPPPILPTGVPAGADRDAQLGRVLAGPGPTAAGHWRTRPRRRMLTRPPGTSSTR